MRLVHATLALVLGACGAGSSNGASSQESGEAPEVLEGVVIVGDEIEAPGEQANAAGNDSPESQPTTEPVSEPAVDTAGAPCDDARACGDGEFCHFPVGDCGDSGAPGECVPIPEICTMQYDPVCGCDGDEYGNECLAYVAAVNVRTDGPCDDSSPL